MYSEREKGRKPKGPLHGSQRAVMYTQNQGRINDPKFANMAREDFLSAFNQYANVVIKRFLQDGDASQNSAVARGTLNEIGAIIFAIAPRSPDLNSIENFFHLINMELKKDTIFRHIHSESFEQFSGRVKRIIIKFPSEKIDKIIDSMDKRFGLVMKANGSRIKY